MLAPPKQALEIERECLQKLTVGPNNAITHNVMRALTQLGFPLNARCLERTSRAAMFRAASHLSAFHAARPVLFEFADDPECRVAWEFQP
eukprot:7759708-Pyramimonas_sp.AAC.1